MNNSIADVEVNSFAGVGKIFVAELKENRCRTKNKNWLQSFKESLFCRRGTIRYDRGGRIIVLDTNPYSGKTLPKQVIHDLFILARRSKRPNILLKVTQLVRKEKGWFARLTIARPAIQTIKWGKNGQNNAPNHFLETKLPIRFYFQHQKHSPTLWQ